MGLREEYLHAALDKTLTFGSKSVDLKGKLLFCWPYVWEESINWDLIKHLTETITEWVQRRIPATTSDRVQSAVLFGLYHCPASWRRISTADQSVYAKLALHIKVTYLFFEIDDTTEDEEGSVHHAKYVKSVGKIVNRIFRYQFETNEDIKHDSLYQSICEISRPVGSFLELLNDCAIDLKETFGVTKDLLEYYARSAGYIFSMQSWCGVKDQLHLLNPYTQYHLRIYTGGVCTMMDLIFLLEGIHIPRSVRDNAFWARYFEVSGFLPCRINDIIGVEKEWQQMKQFGKPVDNVIFHYMGATNCSFEQAVTRGLKEHNLALKEFHDFLKFSKMDQEILEEFTEEEKRIFTRSIDIMAECTATSIQGQTLMSRYNAGVKLTFERCTIYGLEPWD